MISLAGGYLLDQRLRVDPLFEFRSETNTVFDEVRERLRQYEKMMDKPYDDGGIIAKGRQRQYQDSLLLKLHPGLEGGIQEVKADALSPPSFCEKWSELYEDVPGRGRIVWHLPVPGLPKLARGRPRMACAKALEARFDTERLFAHLFKPALDKGMGVHIDVSGPTSSDLDKDREFPGVFVKGRQAAENDLWVTERDFTFYTFRLQVMLSAPVTVWNSEWPGLAFASLGCVLSWALYRMSRRSHERDLHDYGHQLVMRQRLEDMAYIGHEVAAYLTGIFSSLGTLLMRLNRDDLPTEILARELSAAYQLAEHACLFLAEIRDRRSEGEQRLPVAIGDVFGKVAGLAKVDSRFHGISLTARCEADLCVVISRTVLEIVLLNLLRNSAEAIREGGRGGAISLDAVTEEGRVKITVTDDGPGIGEPDALFQPFRSTKKHGTGLGLAYCRRQVENYFDGTIEGGNRPEGGACFKISLPLCGG